MTWKRTGVGKAAAANGQFSAGGARGNACQVREIPVPPPSQAQNQLSVAARAGVFLVFLALAVGLQWAAGAFSSDLARYSDEGAHYVTGLMVRDYLVSGVSQNPVDFAKRFYVHFPRVSFGVWPPLFHLLMGVWLLPTHDGHISVLFLMAAIMATAAYILFQCVRQEFGVIAGLVTGLLLVLLPLSQIMTSTIMADSLVMLMVLATAAATAKWLKSESNRDALWVGVFAGLALMSKGNGMSVGIAVPTAIVLARRFDLLRKPGIYMGGLLAGVLGFGWQLHSLDLYRQMSSFHAFSMGGIREAFDYYVSFMYHTLGWALCALIVVGIAASVGSVRRRDGQWNIWAAMAAAGFGVFAFHVLVPHPVDGRYILAAIAPLMVFIAPAAQRIAKLIPSALFTSPREIPIVLAGAMAVYLAFFFSVPAMPKFGFDRVVAWLEAHPLPNQRYLVISDASGEGAFISDVASSTTRDASSPYIMRSSKLLFVSDWNGNQYRMAYSTPAKVLNEIEALGISYIVIDNTPDLNAFPHWRQVRDLEQQSGGRLQLVFHLPAGVNGDVRTLDIYRVLNYANPPTEKFQFQTYYTLGGSIVE